jgi:hypothetical protein
MEAINNFVAKAFRDTRSTALTLGVVSQRNYCSRKMGARNHTQ